MTIHQSPLFLLGLALLGNLVTGAVMFVAGRITAKREAQHMARLMTRPAIDDRLYEAKRGPTRTIEVYDGPGVPF